MCTVLYTLAKIIQANGLVGLLVNRSLPTRDKKWKQSFVSYTVLILLPLTLSIPSKFIGVEKCDDCAFFENWYRPYYAMHSIKRMCIIILVVQTRM